MLENGTEEEDRWQWVESTEYTVRRFLSPESWGEVLKVEARRNQAHSVCSESRSSLIIAPDTSLDDWVMGHLLQVCNLRTGTGRNVLIEVPPSGTLYLSRRTIQTAQIVLSRRSYIVLTLLYLSIHP